MNALLKQVLRDHIVTEKQFFSTASPLVSEARLDFIRRAYFQYLYGVPEIARILKMKHKEIEYFLEKIAAGAPPSAATVAAPEPSPSAGAYTTAQPPLSAQGDHHENA
jgi:hypothetical protein